ncbi:MAG: ferrous iron transport protein A [Bdellovibrionales bacterium]|nr:ferrous iron transport protein A [Bdellovibrionales bacterium]
MITPCMNLWDLKQHQSGTMKAFSEEMPEAYRHRLQEFGFQKGELVTCLRQTPFSGPKVYQVGDSVVSLTQDLASVVAVEVSE